VTSAGEKIEPIRVIEIIRPPKDEPDTT
jgi:hypothetical protein